jgi:hypothetical protein
MEVVGVSCWRRKSGERPKSEAVTAADKAIDRALAPKKRSARSAQGGLNPQVCFCHREIGAFSTSATPSGSQGTIFRFALLTQLWWEEWNGACCNTWLTPSLPSLLGFCSM